MNEFENIYYYKSEEVLKLPSFLDLSSCEEIRKKQGYERSNFAEPFCYRRNDFYDIFVFTNNKDESICEYWDHNGCVFQFATKNPNQTFECVKEFISLLKNVCIIERSMTEIEDGIKIKMIEDD